MGLGPYSDMKPEALAALMNGGDPVLASGRFDGQWLKFGVRLPAADDCPRAWAFRNATRTNRVNRARPLR
jgi:hypothetical protein